MEDMLLRTREEEEEKQKIKEKEAKKVKARNKNKEKDKAERAWKIPLYPTKNERKKLNQWMVSTDGSTINVLPSTKV
jgi:hypothetical protein